MAVGGERRRSDREGVAGQRLADSQKQAGASAAVDGPASETFAQGGSVKMVFRPRSDARPGWDRERHCSSRCFPSSLQPADERSLSDRPGAVDQAGPPRCDLLSCLGRGACSRWWRVVAGAGEAGEEAVGFGAGGGAEGHCCIGGVRCPTAAVRS